MLQTRLDDSIRVLKSLNKIKNHFFKSKINEWNNFKSTSSNIKDLEECMKTVRLDSIGNPVQYGVLYAYNQFD
jgi:hypothetical protein